MDTPSRVGTRRALFTPSTRSTKRQRTTYGSRATMKIPKSLLPEMKQYIGSLTNGSGSPREVERIPESMSQGLDANQFIGSKFTAKRLRVYYDFTGKLPTAAYRIVLYIPKDPSGAASIPFNSVAPVNTHEVTVLFDRVIPIHSSTCCGTFDVPMNVACEFNTGGTGVRKNNLSLGVFYGDLAGSSMAGSVQYSLWFTDA